MSGPAKGEKVLLNVTNEARRRVVVGLSWDPRVGNSMMDKLNRVRGVNSGTFDLDLSCYAFDEDGHFQSHVDGSPEYSIDGSEKIYHSGDSQDGSGEGDDEQISVELAGMPPHITQIIFLVDIGSAHSFGDVDEPTVRIADAHNNQDFLSIRLDTKEGKHYTACVFCRIVRDENNYDAWYLHNISEFVDMSQIEDWSEALFKYCDKKS